MCGRFVLDTSPEEIAELLGLATMPTMILRFNIAPTQDVLTVRHNDSNGQRHASMMRWGLVPPWSKSMSIGSRLINARSETASQTRAFRHAFREQRCIIPASGFYEWKKTASGKQPYYIHRRDGRLMAFAGLWEQWHDHETGDNLYSCTILTTAPNTLVSNIHNRMPVILRDDNLKAWIDPAGDDLRAHNTLLNPAADTLLAAYPVSHRVNRVVNDDPSLIDLVPEHRDDPLLFD